jgi:hypothetical protein
MGELSRESARAGARRVVIERGGLGWKVSDEGGPFAESTTIDGALNYAANLLEGPGTGAIVSVERYPAMRSTDG